MLLIRQIPVIRAKAKLSAIMIADLKDAVVLPCFIAKSCKNLHQTELNIIRSDHFVKYFFDDFSKIFYEIILPGPPAVRYRVRGRNHPRSPHFPTFTPALRHFLPGINSFISKSLPRQLHFLRPGRRGGPDHPFVPGGIERQK